MLYDVTEVIITRSIKEFVVQRNRKGRGNWFLLLNSFYVCIFFPTWGQGLKITLSRRRRTLSPLFLPSGSRTNNLRSPWIYLHLHASLNAHKGSFGEAQREHAEVRTKTVKKGQRKDEERIKQLSVHQTHMGFSIAFDFFTLH